MIKTNNRILQRNCQSLLRELKLNVYVENRFRTLNKKLSCIYIKRFHNKLIQHKKSMYCFTILTTVLSTGTFLQTDK